MLECPKCHAQNLPNSLYCDECGFKLAEANKKTVGTLPASPAESECISNEAQVQSQAVMQTPNNAIAPGTSNEPSTQLNLPVNNTKATLPTTASQVLKNNLQKNGTAQGMTVGRVGSFFSNLVNSCQKLASSGSALLKNLSSSTEVQSNSTFVKPIMPTDSKGKTLCNKIVAALLGIGILALCIFMIGKKLAIFSLSTFIKQK
ncbi:TPA: hypothetical protein DD394_03595 [bacterium UBP9_UBA11836]|nr:hypothetical protein [bacterium UBP9_UBA11836]